MSSRGGGAGWRYYCKGYGWWQNGFTHLGRSRRWHRRHSKVGRVVSGTLFGKEACTFLIFTVEVCTESNHSLLTQFEGVVKDAGIFKHNSDKVNGCVVRNGFAAG